MIWVSFGTMAHGQDSFRVTLVPQGFDASISTCYYLVKRKERMWTPGKTSSVDCWAALPTSRLSDILITSREGVVVDDTALLMPGDELTVSKRKQRKSMVPSAPSSPELSKPREVTVAFGVHTVKKIDELAGIVDVDFILYVQWHDPTLVGVEIEDRPPYTEAHRKGDDIRPALWNPKLEINNDVSLELMWKPSRRSIRVSRMGRSCGEPGTGAASPT